MAMLVIPNSHAHVLKNCSPVIQTRSFVAQESTPCSGKNDDTVHPLTMLLVGFNTVSLI
jgi:hypothetical protein